MNGFFRTKDCKMILLASLLSFVPMILKVFDFLQAALHYVRIFFPIALGFMD